MTDRNEGTGSGRTGDYRLGGWRVRSDLDLPGVIPWDGDGGHPPDIDILTGPVPDRLDDSVRATPFQQVGRDGTALVTWGADIRFLIQAGRRVVVDATEADPKALAPIVTGSMLGMLAHQREWFPLHASVIVVAGRTIALAGVSGAGKSTLAAYLAGRGHVPLADDLCLLDPHGAGGAWLWPASRRLKLWPDVVTALGIATEGADRERFLPSGSARIPRDEDGASRHLIDPPAPESAGPYRLGMVLVLAEAMPDEQDRIVWKRGADALSVLVTQVYRHAAAMAMGRDVGLLRDGARILGAGTRLGVLRRHRRFDGLNAAARVIEAAAEAET